MQNPTRKRKVAQTLDSWVVPGDEARERCDDDKIVVGPPAKRQALRPLRVHQAQARLPTAHVYVPAYGNDFVKGFRRHPASELECPPAPSPRLLESKTEIPVRGNERRPRRSLPVNYTSRIFAPSEISDDGSVSEDEPHTTENPSTERETQSESDFIAEGSSEEDQSDVHSGITSYDGSSIEPSSDFEADDVKTARRPASKAPKPTVAVSQRPSSNRSTSHKSTSRDMKNLLNRGKGEARGLITALPPLFEIDEIFQDLVQRANGMGFRDALQHLRSRKLRVATMCSGTESPLLAIEMIRDSLRALGGAEEIQIEHLFSGEIVPFKQAYIERNFHPPIIFRDITELVDALDQDNPSATTAYGGRVPIPTGVDICIAGTSCVDFSQLNTIKKGKNDGGESGRTWDAVRTYCKNFRPSIVILENVRNADWDAMLKDYEAIGYESAGVLVDTKDYYIPQTRQRGYMVCFDRQRMKKAGVQKAGLRWTSLMEKFKRPASAPVASFLIPNDQIRSRPQMLEEDRAIREVDWTQCEIRQLEYRQELRLGSARPYTHWQESGGILPPDNANARWYSDQVERVLDSIDAAHLRKALEKNGMFDSRYKTRIWNLSQNIDRDQDNQPFGLVGCITPTGLFFVSDIARPLTAEELLKLQGLPIHRISFTTETHAEMQDLAGNAMSTTVVGSAILSALIAGYKLLDAPHVAELPGGAPAPILLEESTELLPIEPGSHQFVTGRFLEKARNSLRRCYCEGTSSIAEKAIQQCAECGHTACIACGGNPAHKYMYTSEALNRNRLVPADFEEDLRSALPLALVVEFEAESAMGSWNDDYRRAVEKAVESMFTFQKCRRTHCWTIVYRAVNARLELVISDSLVQWRLYALAPKKLSGDSPLRVILRQPIAKADVEDSLLDVKWSWRLPTKTSFPIDIKGSGVKFASWWCRNQMPDFKDHSVWEYLDVNVSMEDDQGIARVINGRYQYLINCGKACDSLFKKISDDDHDQGHVFLFLDPSRTGPSEEDTFVFSHVKEDLEPDEIRPVLGRVDASWRPWNHACKTKQPKFFIDETWVKTAKGLRAKELDSNIVLPSPSNCLSESSCSELHTLIQCEIPVALSFDSQVITADDDRFFWEHAWILETLRRNLPPASGRWQEVKTSSDDLCETCAPKRPLLRWKLGEKGNIQPYEDQETATRYERQIKSRPDVILVKVAYDPFTAKSRFTLGLDILSLAHRAVARLSHSLSSKQRKHARCTWRLVTKSESSKFIFKPFRLQTTSNKPHDAELGMSVRLFPKQCVALSWMREQELGVTFRLEETDEATIPSLGWRVEASAQADVTFRGGICADHPGFGKTITSIALIHTEFCRYSGKREPILSKLMAKQDEEEELQSLVPLAATLIVCPQTLVKQWYAEIEDKLGSLQGVIVISTTALLAKYTMDDFKKAKIVLVSRSVFGSETYTEKLAAFAAVPPPATTSGRSFGQWLKFATKQVPVHLELLKKEGKSSFKAHVKKTYAQNLSSDIFKAVVPSKRLRGAAYAAETAKRSKGSSSTRSKFMAPSTVDMTNIDMPLFEMFYFNRLIVDEFHQYEQREYASIVALKAHSRWGLSATPALGDFYDISQIARLLGISLPIGSDQRGIMKVKNIRELRKDMTDFEHFDTMRVAATNAVHERIHDIDQRFLNTFVRQNIMDFDELVYEDHLVPVALDLTHRVLYTELSQHLNSANMRIKKSTKSKTTDRLLLINHAISESSTAEEALSKAAAYSEGIGLDEITRNRRQEYSQLLADEIPKAIAKAQSEETESFRKLQSRHEADMLGDADTTKSLLELFKRAGSSGGKAKSRSKASKDSGTEDETGGEARPMGSRGLTAKLSTQCGRLVVATRSLRYLENVLKLHESQDVSAETHGRTGCDSIHCERQEGGMHNGAVSSFCGHAICSACYSCLKIKATNQCPAGGCSSTLHDHHLLWVNKSGPKVTAPYGAKIETAVRLLRDIKKGGDQAILFVQFPSQLNEVKAALDRYDIQATVVRTLSDSGRQIQDFRETANTPEQKTVIVLNVSDETAAGSNIQNANHVIFLSPLLRDTRYGYESTMAQAIGRVRRHGQKKPIHVYRLVALDTIDVDILEHRERRSDALVERGAPAVEAPGSGEALGENRGRSGRGTKREPERTQLVKEHGRFSLRPRSWLVGSSGEGDVERVKGKSRVLGWEDFSSLIKFSRAFTEDDD